MANTPNRQQYTQAGSFGKRANYTASATAPVMQAQDTIVQPTEDQDAKNIHALEGVQSAGSSVMMADAGLGLAAFAVGKPAEMMGKGKFRGFVDNYLRAPIWALRNTQINQVEQLGANFTEKAAHLHLKVGNTEKADALFQKAAGKQAAAEQFGGKHFSPISSKASQVMAPVGRQLERLDETAFGRAIGAPFRWFSNMRHNVVDNKYKVILNRGLQIENTGGFIGIGSKAGNGSKAGVAIEGFNPDSILNLRNTTFSSQAAHVEALDAEIKKVTELGRDLMKKGKPEEYKKLLGVAESLQEAKVQVLAKHWHGNVAQGGLGSLLKNLPKAAGRMSIFHALAGVGLLAGIGVTWMNSGRENKLSKKALVELAADVYGVPAEAVTKEMLNGANAHPLIQEASRVHEKASQGRTTISALETMNDAIFMGTMRGNTAMMHGSMGGGAYGMAPMLAVAPQMMINPMIPGGFSLRDVLIPENQTLNAYAMMKQAEKTGMPLQPSDKIYLVRQMMASVPAIARHSGADNTLAPAVAAELVSQNLSTAQIIQTISNPQRFMALTREMMEKQKHATEEQAKAEQEAKAKDHGKAHGEPAKETPSLSLSNVQHEGRIDARQHQKGA